VKKKVKTISKNHKKNKKEKEKKSDHEE